MTARPQPMAGNSEAADDLIAELAKLMAQDANETPPPKPAAPSPFTVRIPGEPAGNAAPRREEPVRIPQTTQAPQPSVRATESERDQSSAGDQPDPFRFAFDLPPRREPAAAAPATPTPAPVPTPAPATAQAAAPIVIKPEPAPAIPEHDSIADLIAAELAMDTQPTPVAPRQATPPRPPANQPVNEAPVETTQPKPAPNPAAAWKPVNLTLNLGAQDRPAQPQLRPVTPQPIRPEASRSEQDQFKVPPVFGLGAAPAAQPVQAKAPEPIRVESPSAVIEPSFTAAPAQSAPTPSVAAPAAASRPAADDNLGSDPIDEIENLIGRAMRVDLEQPQPAEPRTERSALRSLATPQLPKQSTPANRGISSADEAILAAAQASGAQIGWVEAPEVDEPEPRQLREKRVRALPRFGFSRAFAGPLVAVTLLLAAGFGLYWVLGLGSGEPGPAPLLTADATPVKETPPAQPEPAAEEQSVVFNEMNGVVPGAEEQLVSRDQADVNEVTQVAAVPEVSAEGLANRKVRTVTVRPDGTIVSGDNSVAGSSMLPVDRPNVPPVPGAQTASPGLLASTAPAGSDIPAPAIAPAPAPGADPGTAATAVPTSEGAVPPPEGSVPPEAETAALPEPAPAPTPPVPVVAPGATVPAVDVAGNPLPGKTTVIPLQRPSSFAQRPVAAAEPTAPLAPLPEQAAAAPQLPPPPSGQPSTTVPGATEVAALPNDAPAYVQLASQRTEEEARTTAQNLVTRFGPLFGGANMEVQRVDLGARGIFYRVRVPASSTEQAANICTNVKAAGGDCFTM